MDAAEWLRGVGLEKYMPAFRANDIDGAVLRRLTGEDLRELVVSHRYPIKEAFYHNFAARSSRYLCSANACLFCEPGRGRVRECLSSIEGGPRIVDYPQ